MKNDFYYTHKLHCSDLVIRLEMKHFIQIFFSEVNMNNKLKYTFHH